MHIRITEAARFKTVRIGDEKVNVGEPTYVSDNFVSRLKDEFPSFKFEELEDGAETGDGDGQGDGAGTDDNDKDSDE